MTRLVAAALAVVCAVSAANAAAAPRRPNIIVILADEVYADLAYDAPVPPIAALDPDAPIISFSSISKTYQAPGWRAGWLGVSGGERLDAAPGCYHPIQPRLSRPEHPDVFPSKIKTQQ